MLRLRVHDFQYLDESQSIDITGVIVNDNGA
jgi:hypothetical protein